MACIICFLGDEFQENLRNISQQRAEKFEKVISQYKVNFIAEFKNIEAAYNCPLHKNYNRHTLEWVNGLEISLRKIKNIDSYFDVIRGVYVKWLNGNIKNSTVRLTEIMTKYDLLRSTTNDKRIFFKGRYSKEYLSTEELYHIPHNKRYLISNQRYSLTGQPIIYLGLSIVDVFAELKLAGSLFDEINFSSFVLKQGESLNIFDFTSGFESRIIGINNNPVFVKFYDRLKEGEISRMFHKFILVSLCSFVRRKESENWSFCEEYVIPQLITEIVKERKFDGILFYSTRVSKPMAYSNDPSYISKHKENIALFTKYKEGANYDTDLIKKFEISKPMKFRNKPDIDSLELERIRKQIKEMVVKSKKLMANPFILYAKGLETAYFDRLMVKNLTDETFINYRNHPAGKMHQYLIYQILLTIRNDLMLRI